MLVIFFFNDTATTEIYTLSLHDALPIWKIGEPWLGFAARPGWDALTSRARAADRWRARVAEPDLSPHLRDRRSEEHTSELQSRQYLVCRLLLEKNKQQMRLYYVTGRLFT